MKDETRGAIVIAVVIAGFCGTVYFRRANRQPLGESIKQALSKEASDILKADAIALVSQGDEGIEIWSRGASDSARLETRAALATWLCSPEAPKETAVVMVKGLPLARGRLESASRDGRLVVEELRGAPIRLECPARARFYSMEVRLGDTPQGK